MRASCRANSNFSLKFIEKPGDCSPSRKVVSKIIIRSLIIVYSFPGAHPIGDLRLAFLRAASRRISL